MTPNGDCTLLHSIRLFALELNYDVHDKEILAILKLSNDGDIIEGSGLPIDVVTITGFAILFNNQNPHVLTSTLVNTFLDSTL